MKKIIKRILNIPDRNDIDDIYHKFKNYTMIKEDHFKANIELVRRYSYVPGCVVECGVWRGGMSASMASVLGSDRKYYLFDSFEGLPPAKEIDGKDAIEWQQNPDAPMHHNNCTAEIDYAKKAMSESGAKNFHLIKGWFENTLPDYPFEEGIAILRLDGDWYDSTMQCLRNLYDKVVSGGIIIIDDYYTWDGCSRAVHDFLSETSSTERISSLNNVCYIVKN